MNLMLFSAQKQGALDGAIAGELSANRLALPPTPSLAWSQAKKAQVVAGGDSTDLTWRIAYAVACLQAA